MTDVQAHVLQVRALRNLRKENRKLQTRSETLERHLDRMIAGKRRLRASSFLLVGKAWSEIQATIQVIIRALNDALRTQSL